MVSAEKVRLFDNNKYIQIKIKDTGKGIENIDAAGLWFSCLKVKDKVNQNGIGFGLNISKLLVQKLGGHFTIKNNEMMELGQFSAGVTVTIHIPYKRSQGHIMSVHNVGLVISEQIPQFMRRSESKINLSDSLEIEDEKLFDEISVITKIEKHTIKETNTLSVKKKKKEGL